MNRDFVPPHGLTGWVFRQKRIWVDADGSEYEIESMPHDQARYLIGFCRLHAAHITLLVAFEYYADALRLQLIERRSNDSRVRALEAISACSTRTTSSNGRR